MARARAERRRAKAPTRPVPKKRADRATGAKRGARSTRPAAKAKPGRVAARAAPRPSNAELMLLALARDVAGTGVVAAGGAQPPLVGALERVAAAFGPAAPLSRALAQAWVGSRSDKTRALALVWAREQLRLGLQDTLIAAGHDGAVGAIPSETLAWLLLAACESLAHEPSAAVPDRVRALLELAGPVDERA